MTKIKLLCLHGAGCNGNILRNQLAPLARAFGGGGGVDFHCVSAPNEVDEAPGVAAYYSGPYLSWLEFPKTDTDQAIPTANLDAAMEYIDEIVEEDGPFNGILGFSQGATMAFCYLHHRLRMRPFDPPFIPFACAIFISASGTAKDQSTLVEYIGSTGRNITIPTLHVYGKQDVDSEAAMTMYEHCKAGDSEFVLHPHGHAIPTDAESVQRIVQAIKAVERKSATRIF
ncbi:related to DUF341 family oxidoreductase [Cephalotrichum gorgonifer]|uniref:Related to DUF341 family oxidoreductase n=1 Tax=Cephalotrichum gorgonifer TaxID=2041049 RepID=A0AAE8MTS8_9PEZI|nr:related to DUF341 family oxidoreductase [Cephalotrichum gorgonifer]